jgi:hypothetical protein
VEMQVEKLENNKAYHKCKKCGESVIETIEVEETVQV